MQCAVTRLFVAIQLCVCITCLIADHNLTDSYTDNDESRLLRRIMDIQSRHNILARPVINSSQTIQVSFRVNIVHILEFDEKNQVIAFLIWKHYSWNNPFVTWSPDEYGGLESTVLPSDKVWTPDIVLYNSVEPDPQFHGKGKGNEELISYFNGDIVWVPVVKVKVPCTVDMRYFPYDTQRCFLKFGSWAHTESKINLTFISDKGHLSYDEYTPNMEWDIVKSYAVRNAKNYGCCGDETYIDLSFHFKLKRHSGFYSMFLLLPVCMLSIMVLTIFWIPPHRPDRTGLGMSLFGSFMVLILVIVQLTPPTTTSQLGIYCCLNTVMIAFATVLSATMVNIARLKVPFPALFAQTIKNCKTRSGQYQNSTNKKYWIESNSNMIQNNQTETIHEKTGTSSNIPNPISMTNNQKWEQFAKTLDRVLFLCYVIVFAIFFVLNIATLFVCSE